MLLEKLAVTCSVLDCAISALHARAAMYLISFLCVLIQLHSQQPLWMCYKISL